MKIYVKNKPFSWGGDSEVLDENQQDVYKVKGKLISPTQKKKIYDMQGKLLYVVRNKFWTFFCKKTMIFDANKKKIATIKKGDFSANADYEIDHISDVMRIEGKFFGSTSKIIKNEQEIATLTKDFSIGKDCFTLETDYQDIPFLVALVIGFDNLTDSISKRSK